MGKESAIAWTDATFNPWWGCEKASSGCTHCYAETLDNRMYPNAKHWGKNAPHRFFGEKHWNEVNQWNNKAKEQGKTIKVFCGSMCDIFQDSEELWEPRQKLYNLIEETKYLTWLLLTKRPENLPRMLPFNWLMGDFPGNTWLGVTVEDQRHTDRLTMVKPYIGLFNGIFVSVEPMLGTVVFDNDQWHLSSWIIIGGESGVGCRSMELDWAYDLMCEAQSHKVPVFIKQLGGFPDKQDIIELFPKYLQVREFPVGLD